MIARRLIIYGRVQGVYFRQSAKEKAIELGVSGTARNCADGTVEVLAEADAAIMNDFIEWCRNGPEAARVDRVDINEHPLKNFRGFVILR